MGRHHCSRWRRAGILPLALVALLAAIPKPDSPSEPPAASMEEAVARVERAHGGQILSARGEQQGARTVYRIRILTRDRQVRHLEIPGPEGASP